MSADDDDQMSPLAGSFCTPQLRSAFQRLEKLEDIVKQRHPNWDDLSEEEMFELLDRARDDELMPVLVEEGIFEYHGLDEEGRKIFTMSAAVREAELRARNSTKEEQ
jgi:hypothetical protein